GEDGRDFQGLDDILLQSYSFGDMVLGNDLLVVGKGAVYDARDHLYPIPTQRQQILARLHRDSAPHRFQDRYQAQNIPEWDQGVAHNHLWGDFDALLG